MPRRNGINKTFGWNLLNIKKPSPRSLKRTTRFQSTLLITFLLLESLMLSFWLCCPVLMMWKDWSHWDSSVGGGGGGRIHVSMNKSRPRLKWLFIVTLHTQTFNSSLMVRPQVGEGKSLSNGMLSCMPSEVSWKKFVRFLFLVLKFLLLRHESSLMEERWAPRPCASILPTAQVSTTSALLRGLDNPFHAHFVGL